MKRRDDSGQVKFWQIFLIIVIVGVIAFDLGSPQLAKVQLRQKAQDVALDASQSYLRTSGMQRRAALEGICERVVQQITAYGAEFIAPDPESECPEVSDDGKVSFSARKKAPSIILSRVGLRDYYTVTVSVSEKSVA